ncbi:hypothetical protein [Oceanicaulis sp. MMSF_3324]|uniref:hypothetical protein n=1 Tax=Oceanicaulis sp. MMSF_3324 TaxID=3046702 RepID=UPI00273E9BE2|nr:hypothetical protein [Oceanicaulis sp. MMSF_3324]
MSDPKRLRTQSGCVVGIKAITPNDSEDLANEQGEYPTHIFFGEVGAVTVHDCFDNAITFAAGEIMPSRWHAMSVKRVLETGSDTFTAGAIKIGWGS